MKDIEAIFNYNDEQWYHYLKAISNNNLTDFEIQIGDENLFRKILYLFNLINESGRSVDNLAKAVYNLLFEYAGLNSKLEQQYYLIQSLSLFKNQDVSNKLLLLFKNRKFYNKFYNNVNLHTQFLLSLFNYNTHGYLDNYFRIILPNKNNNNIVEPQIYLIGLKYYNMFKTNELYISYLDELLNIDFLNDSKNYEFGKALGLSFSEYCYNNNDTNHYVEYFKLKIIRLFDSNYKMFLGYSENLKKWLEKNRSKIVLDPNLGLLDKFVQQISNINSTDKVNTLLKIRTDSPDNSYLEIKGFIDNIYISNLIQNYRYELIELDKFISKKDGTIFILNEGLDFLRNLSFFSREIEISEKSSNNLIEYLKEPI